MKFFISFVLLFFISQTSSLGCPKQCRCTGSRFDCSNQNIKIVSNGLFGDHDSVNKIDLSRNQVVMIHPEAFLKTQNLKEVSLASNPKLYLPRNSSIIKSPSVETLNLSNCTLKSIPGLSLSDIPNLLALNLSNNELQDFSVEVLKYVPRLTHLDLSGNKFNKLNMTFIEKIPSGIDLNLSGNNLSTMSLEEAMVLSKMPFVRLDDNPWKCDCDLVRAKAWSVASRSKLNLKCQSPQRYKGKSWDELTTIDCRLRPMSARSPRGPREDGKSDDKTSHTPYSIAIVGAFLAVAVGTIALSIIANRRTRNSREKPMELKQEEAEEKEKERRTGILKVNEDAGEGTSGEGNSNVFQI